MNWLQRLAAKLLTKPDMVLLRMYDGRHLLKPVTWFCDIPFAAPYLPPTRCELLPGGKLIGAEYVIGWLPASECMREFYNAATIDASGVEPTEKGQP